MRIILLALILVVSGCTTLERLYLPDAKVGDDHWTQSADSGKTVDHAPWGAFLRTYVQPGAGGVHLVDYANVSAADHQALKAYITDLQAVAVSELGRAEQLAYWINLYNAVTVDLVLDAYPVETIRTISSSFLGTGPWDNQVVTVEDRTLSLNNIEHAIVRPVFQDPRIHYALNCAAFQCPNLARVPYRGTSLDEALDLAARAYVNDPRGVTVEPDGRLTLSKIYVWFKEDFGGSEATVLAHLEAYAEPDLAAVLAERPSVKDYVYDWSLNDQAVYGLTR